MSEITNEMRQWLTENRETYEFYLLHSAMHNPEWRMRMLSTPVTPDDFWREEYAIVMGALVYAAKIVGAMEIQMPCPPSVDWMSTYINQSAKDEAADDETIRGAMGLMAELQDPKYSEMFYTVGPYFKAWYGSVRAKKAAREINKYDIPDVIGQVAIIEQALSSAEQAAGNDEEDQMDDFLYGEVLERVARRPTGIQGLDLCLNGGAGPGECYLLFSGTGGGKSICAGQISWHDAAFNKGMPLVITTELRPREYAARTVSNAAGIPINVLQDCENVAQIRQAVAADSSSMYKMGKVDEVLDVIRSKIRYQKVSADDGMEARILLERECMTFQRKMGSMPSLVILDWLGSLADVKSGSTTSERAMAWEISANQCVKFAERTGIPTFVLAQAVNDSQTRSVLTLGDIGISKGIAKNMVLAVGITNAIKKSEITDAILGKQDMPKSMVHDEQLFCVCKARKGEGRNIKVKRNFRFQRFTTHERD